MKKSIAIFFCIAVVGSAACAQKKRPLPPPPPPKIETTKYIITLPAAELDAFYAKNPSVSKAYYKKNKELVIELKDGKKESYDLKVKDQYRSFSEKYMGEPPALPQLPPPALPPKKE